MGKPSKNQIKSTGGVKDEQVKYSDPRMAYSSTKKEMVIKESSLVTMSHIFGDVPSASSPVVVCEDQNGFYLTSKNMIDTPILDPYRNYKRGAYQLIHNAEDNTFKVINQHNVEYVI